MEIFREQEVKPEKDEMDFAKYLSNEERKFESHQSNETESISLFTKESQGSMTSIPQEFLNTENVTIHPSNKIPTEVTQDTAIN